MDRLENNDKDFKKLLHEQKERLKELACINQTTSVIREGKPLDETLQKIVTLLPPAWQYPENTVARIKFKNKNYQTSDFTVTEWKISQEFITIDGEEGLIEVYYTSEFRPEDEGPFLREERDLIQNLSSLIAGYVNSLKAHNLYRLTKIEQEEEYEEEVKDEDILKSDTSGRKLLQKFLDRHKAERDLFRDLQPFRVKEILLVANLYDAYSIEGEGRFTEHILGEFNQLGMSSIPRITGVSSEEEAFRRLKSRHYDLIIFMIGVDKDTPLQLCRKIKEKHPFIPAYLLLNNAEDIPYVKKMSLEGFLFDNCFVWTGESKVFYAMVKLLEDSVNADNDTKKGLARVILIVEDSAEYYSTYLPMLYDLVMEQTKTLVGDETTDDISRVLKLKTRPKILLASTYEDAIAVYTDHRNNLLCLISDIRFPRNGIIDDKAGIDLIKKIREELPDLPAMLQSSDPSNANYAYRLKASFINKNSESLMQDLKAFINYYLGFGHFIYRDNKGRQIAVAKTMKEFESYLETIPDESLLYHATKNHFSLWLMARGEAKIAGMINPMKVSDFQDLNHLRKFLVDIVRKRRREMNRGKVVNFEESTVIDESSVISLAGGSLGGKGRGLAFINALIYSFELGRLIPGINIKTPVTAIIGTDEFDMFMERNHLWEKVRNEKDFDVLQKAFTRGTLSYTLQKELRILVKLLKKPLAVRSSSLFEDSLTQPFSGIFGTYMLPNNHTEFDVRLRQVENAIKLVFASIYSKRSRTWFEAINFKIDQEKMGVIIQEVVGNRFEDVYYPHISGTAQSYNFYPVARMDPNDGFAAIAAGLGQYVVEGERSFLFSPSYPALDILSQKDLYLNSQVHFYAIDMAGKDINLLEGEFAGLTKLDISDAERHGTLKHSASVYDSANDSITPGLSSAGPRVMNFAGILKFNYIPLANALKIVLEIIKEAFGTPVEIEFAVDLTKDSEGNASLYLLQIKPLTGNEAGYNIKPESIAQEDIIIRTGKSMGNGLIDNITDVIFANPSEFNSMFTEKMAEEIEILNEKMIRENRQYVLIGPGRWGTRDRFAGIPVAWPQISNAKVIVEVSLPDLPLDPSLGSHFFHNVTSMKIGYFSISNPGHDLVSWQILEKQELIYEGRYFRHVRFRKPIIIRMDGKKRMAVVTINN